MIRLLAIAVSSTGALLSSAASATSWYVSPMGDDAMSGRSVGAAFWTGQRAVAAARSGDVVYFLDGSHAPFLITRSGSKSRGDITYRAYPGHAPVVHLPPTSYWGIGIQGGVSYITLDGLSVVGGSMSVTHEEAMAYYHALAGPPIDARFIGWCVAVGGNPGAPISHHIILSNLTVSYCPGTGIGTQRVDYLTIRNVVAAFNGWWSPSGASGVSVYEPAAIDSSTDVKIIVSGVTAFGNAQFVPSWPFGFATDGNGIIIDDTKNAQNAPNVAYGGRVRVENSVTYNNGASGVLAYSSAHVDVVNNTSVEDNFLIDRGAMSPVDSDDVRVVNNVIVARSDRVTTAAGNTTNLYWDYNLVFGGNAALVPSPNDLVSDPMLVDTASADFRLLPESPALWSGTDFLSPTVDMVGRSRPVGSVSRGAYQ